MSNEPTATILVQRLEVSIAPPTVSFHGKVTGVVAPGMFMSIPMNNSFAMTCEVNQVHEDGPTTVLVVAADDAEEAEFLASFNPLNETLYVALP